MAEMNLRAHGEDFHLLMKMFYRHRRFRNVLKAMASSEKGLGEQAATIAANALSRDHEMANSEDILRE